MPIAAANTGTRNGAFFALRIESKMITATPMSAPIVIMSQGNLPPNRPFATDAMRLACGACSGRGCSSVGAPPIP
jgi:hypothetical protein